MNRDRPFGFLILVLLVLYGGTRATSCPAQRTNFNGNTSTLRYVSTSYTAQPFHKNPSRPTQQVDESTERFNQLTLGLTDKKPEKGIYFRIGDRYMVPYQVKIPGTEVEFTMMPVPGGTFLMGSDRNDKAAKNDESPPFEVTVRPFWIGKHEVTWAEFKRFMDLNLSMKQIQKSGLRIVKDKDELDAVTAPSSIYDPSFTFKVGEGLTSPAATMSQFSAMQYTKWLSLSTDTFYRLPTESEWEYACRAGTNSKYYFGDDPEELTEHAWIESNSDLERHEVGKLKPNPWGLHDMYGNVAEWVLDSYSRNGYDQVERGKRAIAEADYAKSDKKHPRVARGGTFQSQPQECRSASRMASSIEWNDEDPNLPRSPWWYTSTPADGVGFRIIRPLSLPGQRSDMEPFWCGHDESLKTARDRIENNGRGAYGIVDRTLSRDIEKHQKDR